ncbi:MAG TPA: L,D-transpeptidase family protein [Mycobacteriales bacterium]|nr:L,D-transpeptidase family protein [Mycobacteriales bacterium]
MALAACGAERPASGGVQAVPAQSSAAAARPDVSRPAPVSDVPRLALGAHGPAVRQLQQQLTDLGYWLGRVDGRFGDATQQAVYALQKVAAITPDGSVGRKTWRALRDGLRPVPRTQHGTRVEIDLTDDVLMFVAAGQLQFVLNTSTGGGYTYYEYGVAHLAATPTGHFHIYNQIDGLHISPLGEMWRPKYFSGGYAIHGDSFVPPYPASHGCVRVSNEAMDWIWADHLLPIGMKVFIYH